MSQESPLPVVCQLVHGLPVGGTEVLVARLVRRMAGGFRIVVGCLDEIGELGERLVDEGFLVRPLGRRPGFDWTCVRRLAQWLDEQRVDLIHAHQYTPFAYAAAMRVLGKRPRIVFTEHGRFYPDRSSRKRRWFNRIMTGRDDRLVAVGQSVRQALIDKEGLPAARIDVIYNGVELEPLVGAQERRGEVRRELGFSDDDFVVLQVARLDVIKDHATALRTICAAVQRSPRMKLVLVGDGPERAQIEGQIAEMGLHAVVTLLGQRHDVPRLLAAGDALLLTSVSEGIPVTIIEGMAAGLPVVATNVGGVPEVIEHSVSGLLAPSGDASALAAALVQLAADPSLRERIGGCAARRAADRFSERAMIDRYASIYAETLASPRAPRRPTPHADLPQCQANLLVLPAAGTSHAEPPA